MGPDVSVSTETVGYVTTCCMKGSVPRPAIMMSVPMAVKLDSHGQCEKATVMTNDSHATSPDEPNRTKRTSARLIEPL